MFFFLIAIEMRRYVVILPLIFIFFLSSLPLNEHFPLKSFRSYDKNGDVKPVVMSMALTCETDFELASWCG